MTFGPNGGRSEARETRASAGAPHRAPESGPENLRRIVAEAVHELANPLTAIAAHCDLLARRAGDPGVRDHARGIEVAALRCGSILKNLRSLSRRPEDHADLDLCGVLEKVLLVAGPELEAGGVEVRAEARARSQVRGDSSALQQLFANLVMNARDAMEGGGRLTLRCAERDGFVEVEVSDTGTGIPEEVRECIFEPYFTTKPPGKGTGLGLAIVREIVLDHGGAVEVESHVGRGTTFRVRLPLAEKANGQPTAPPERGDGWNQVRTVPGQSAIALSAR